MATQIEFSAPALNAVLIGPTYQDLPAASGAEIQIQPLNHHHPHPPDCPSVPEPNVPALIALGVIVTILCLAFGKGRMNRPK